MQYLEFKVINIKLMAMGGGDPLKQMEERSAYLEAVRKKAEAQATSGAAYDAEWNPFPKWVRDIIKEMAVEQGSKARYEDENAIYRVRLKGGREEYDDFYNDFQARFTAAKDATKESAAWFDENRVHVTATADNEHDALNELDAHHGGVQAQREAMDKSSK